MKSFIRKLWNSGIPTFLIIGGGNALLTMLMMYVFYNQLQWGYWISSAVAFALCSIISFILNKKFTFKNNDSILKTGIRFAVVIVFCYITAYSIARPVTRKLLANMLFSEEVIDQISMLAGQVLFTSLNYLGQRFIAFKQEDTTDL